jgi:hypothetical protein
MASGKKARRENSESRRYTPVEYGFTDVKPLNFIQGEYLRAIQTNQIIFGVGSAGTGKTYVAASARIGHQGVCGSAGAASSAGFAASVAVGWQAASASTLAAMARRRRM